MRLRILPMLPKFPILTKFSFFGRNWLAGLCCWAKLARWVLLLDEIGSLRSPISLLLNLQEKKYSSVLPLAICINSFSQEQN